jgi:hypothetical protein
MSIKLFDTIVEIFNRQKEKRIKAKEDLEFSEHKLFWDHKTGYDLTREIYDANKELITAYKPKYEAASKIEHKPAFSISDGHSTMSFGGGWAAWMYVADEMRNIGNELKLTPLR